MIIDQGKGFDGGDFTAVVTSRSNNSKTGDVRQVFILPTLTPSEASEPSIGKKLRGRGETVCGDCSLLAGGCYAWALVRMAAAVSRKIAGVPVRKGVKATTYGVGVPDTSGDFIRWGALGEPVLIREDIVVAMNHNARGWTGYTHQWRQYPNFKRWFMASCETPEEAQEARAAGWRVFLVTRDPPGKGYARCPADPNRPEGSTRTCEECGLCSGTDGKGKGSVWIAPHGREAMKV